MGRDEPILVEIPKGTHTVTFRERESAMAAVSAPTPAAPPIPEVEPAPARVLPFSWKWAVLASAAVLAAAALLLASRPDEHSSATAPPPGNDPLSLFLRDVLQSKEEPLVVFSNAELWVVQRLACTTIGRDTIPRKRCSTTTPG